MPLVRETATFVVSFVQKITNGDETQLPNFSVCLAADRALDGVE
jgi:hypothetical protein